MRALRALRPARSGRFEMASLIGLGRLQKIRRILRDVHGVADERVATGYLEASRTLGYTSTELIWALLRIVPRTYVADVAAAEIARTLSDKDTDRIAEDALNALLALTDSRRHKAIALAHAESFSRVDPEGDDALVLDTVLEFDDSIDWRPYFDENSVTAGAAEGNRVMLVADDKAKYLITAHHADLGQLIGQRVVFTARETSNGFVKIPRGFALYGPKVDFPAASYFLDVDIEIAGRGELTLDIASNGGLRKLFEITFTGRACLRHKFQIRPTDSEIEVRIASEFSEPLSARINKILIVEA
jgi:hypothetical protein